MFNVATARRLTSAGTRLYEHNGSGVVLNNARSRVAVVQFETKIAQTKICLIQSFVFGQLMQAWLHPLAVSHAEHNGRSASIDG